MLTAIFFVPITILSRKSAYLVYWNGFLQYNINRLLVFQFFIDDGVSGVTFDRPNFNRMIAEIEAGNVATVIVKDMSRLKSL